MQKHPQPSKSQPICIQLSLYNQCNAPTQISCFPPSKTSHSPLSLSTGGPLRTGPVERAAALSGQVAAAAVAREVATAVVVQQVGAQAVFQGAVVGVAEGVVRLEHVAPAVQQIPLHLVLWLRSPSVIDCSSGTGS